MKARRKKRKLLWAILVILAIIVCLAGSAWLVFPRLMASPALPDQTPPPMQLVPLNDPSPTPQFVSMAAPPTAQPPVIVPGNLLTNPSFEGDYVTWGDANNVAPGWRSWYFPLPPCLPWKPDCWITCPSNCIQDGKCLRDYGCFWQQPEFAEITHDPYYYRIHSGTKAQKYFSFSRMHQGGLYQQVSGLTPGALLELSGWMQAWMCYDPDATGICEGGLKSSHPSEMHLKIGIDPTGGTVPTSTAILWSEEKEAFDRWVHFSVQAQAVSSTVTVFTHARPDWDWARINNDIYLDDVNLVVAGSVLSVGFSAIQPPQPELGQRTAIQVTANQELPGAHLVITDPLTVPTSLGEGALSGSGPYTWTWHFTPTTPGVHQLAFSAATLSIPVTTSLQAVAAARLAVQPSEVWLGQNVNVYVSAYRAYFGSQLTVTTPADQLISTTYDSIGNDGTLYTRTWHFSSSIAGLHRITYTADLLEAPVAASMTIASAAGSPPPAGAPVSTPVTLSMWAYYPYTNVVVTVADPHSITLTSPILSPSLGQPIRWEWIFTPTLDGAYVYTFTAARLDTPVGGRFFAGGYFVYLPLVIQNGSSR